MKVLENLVIYICQNADYIIHDLVLHYLLIIIVVPGLQRTKEVKPVLRYSPIITYKVCAWKLCFTPLNMSLAGYQVVLANLIRS